MRKSEGLVGIFSFKGGRDSCEATATAAAAQERRGGEARPSLPCARALALRRPLRARASARRRAEAVRTHPGLWVVVRGRAGRGKGAEGGEEA